MKRRRFLNNAAKTLPLMLSPAPAFVEAAGTRSSISRTITLFLCSDVTTGGGIDQILPDPSDPRIMLRRLAPALK